MPNMAVRLVRQTDDPCSKVPDGSMICSSLLYGVGMPHSMPVNTPKRFRGAHYWLLGLEFNDLPGVFRTTPRRLPYG